MQILFCYYRLVILRLFCYYDRPSNRTVNGDDLIVSYDILLLSAICNSHCALLNLFGFIVIIACIDGDNLSPSMQRYSTVYFLFGTSFKASQPSNAVKETSSSPLKSANSKLTSDVQFENASSLINLMLDVILMLSRLS